jgi:SAM-dependent methyltransferase
MKALLAPIYGLLERHFGYALVQKLGRPTVNRFREIVRRCFEQESAGRQRVLDLACGGGAYRELFPLDYVGIDINPDYIARAREHHSGSFYAMDCRVLQFEDDQFDAVVTIAATHHLADDDLRSTIAEAIRVARPGGRVHVIDAILPRNRLHIWKEAWFRLDRGGFPRYAESLLSIVRTVAEPAQVGFVEGPLHDVIHITLIKTQRSSPHGRM